MVCSIRSENTPRVRRHTRKPLREALTDHKKKVGRPPLTRLKKIVEDLKRDESWHSMR